ncbi:MAG: TIGR03013 family XrtA/PEP-CTERM system glycosyltransferase [Planctomycetota bacterium]
MTIGGVRLRGAAAVYVLIEDAITVALLVGAFAFAHVGQVGGLASPQAVIGIVALLLLTKGAFFVCGLYDFRHLVTRPVFWTRVVGGAVLATALVWASWVAAAGEGIAALAFAIAFPPAVALSRLIYELASRSPRMRRRLLFLGAGNTARRTAAEILDLRSREFELVGFLGENENERGWRIGGRPVLGVMSELESVVKERSIDRIVVAVADRRVGLPLEALLRMRLAGVEVVEEPRVHEEIAGKIPVEDLRPSWLIFSDGFSRGRFRNVSKRLFDLGVAVVGLILSAPLTLAVALAVRLDSKGPILFRQTRVGAGGREFTIYKFRSMCVDAEAGGTPQWAKQNDPRVTRIGAFLRKSRLDEIPQMWNVLEGTMSFVGPRPERPFFVDQLRESIPFYDQRHAVKPGITGWAQVRFRYGSDESDQVEKLRYDMFYIKHHSILFDLRILFETVRVVFQRNMGR